jgi:TRAP-type mannitol/chloroaromatic compound transport system substrate-binding protein
LKRVSEEVVAEIAEKDAASNKVYASYKRFRDQVMQWHDVSERAYLNARAGG